MSLLARLLDAGPDALFVYDERGVLLDANAFAERSLGVARAALLAQNIRDWIGGVDDSALFSAATCVAEQRRSDGTTHYVEVRVTPHDEGDRRLFLCVARSIGEHGVGRPLALEGDSLADEDRWRWAIDAADEGVFEWDLQSGRVWLSAKWTGMLGYDEGEIGENELDWTSLVHPEDVSRVQDEHLRHFRGETDQYNCEYRIRAKDGNWRWVLARGRLVTRSASGEPLRFIGTQLDITERIENAELIRTAKEAAEAGERAKSAFIATISHELRTPMNGVMVLANLLLESKLDAEQREMIEMIQRSGVDLLVLINDILDYSRFEAGKMRLMPVAFDLRSALETAARPLEVQARAKGLAMHVAIDIPRGRLVMADIHRLRQLLTNLLGNSIKFTHQGSITVTAKELSLEDERCDLELRVIDTGIGIPAHLHAQIFEAFKQGEQGDRRRYGGSGLGLVISRQIARAMDGDITFESVEHQGSTFILRLPLPRTWLVPRHDSPTPFLAPTQLTFRPLELLLVDDNETSQRVGTLLLEHCGHRVTLAESGARAIELLGARRFDCVLMDLQMPELDGLHTTRKIRSGAALDPKVPILALTAAGMPGDRERCLAAGMDDFALKPIDRGELSAAFLHCGMLLTAPPAPQLRLIASEHPPPRTEGARSGLRLISTRPPPKDDE